METLQKERPAKPRCLPRRSMTELIGALTGGNVEAWSSEQAPIGAWRLPAAVNEEIPAAKSGRKIKSLTRGLNIGARDAAARLPSQRNVKDSAREDDDDTLRQLDEIVLSAAKSASDRRSWMLENLRAGALPAAKKSADADLQTLSSAESAKYSRAADQTGDARAHEQQLPAPAETAADYRAAALALTNANVNAALEFAQLVAHGRSPDEIFAWSIGRLREHVDLVIAHMNALGINALGAVQSGTVKRLQSGTSSGKTLRVR